MTAAPSLPLDTRQARIARRLLETVGPSSVGELADDLKLTERMVRYNLGSIEGVLAAHGLKLARRRGVGIWLEGPPAARSELLTVLDRAPGPSVLEPGDRRNRLLLALLDAAPEPVRSESFEDALGVSRATVRRDMREVESWLEAHRLHLRRIAGRGVLAVGGEVDIRAGLLALLLEVVPPPTLARRLSDASGATAISRPSPPAPDTDVDRFLQDLELATFAAILSGELRDLDEADPTVTAAALYLAIVAARIRAGRVARLGAGRLRSLLDHPASASASRIASAVETAIGVPLGRMDVAAITESLLGLTQLVDLAAQPEAGDVRYIDRVISAASARIHPALANDEQLRTSLSEHVRRLHVRLRFGLPVSNPLQQEVRRRYPDVYRAAAEILDEIGPLFGHDMPVEEVGLLTMYLAGSLERHRLRPKVRVTVVCPAGMATAWILVSRLVAEFPQIDVIRVVSKAGFETEPGEGPDLVVSTIPLEESDGPPPSIVVGPLLREADVRRINRALAALGPTVGAAG